MDTADSCSIQDQRDSLSVERLDIYATSAAVPIMKLPVSHYDTDYFKWVNLVAETGVDLDKRKFLPFLAASDKRVLDFGCGGGTLLASLPVAERIGIEINPVAIESATRAGIEVHSNFAALANGSIDAVISHHAIEHVEAPLEVLREIRRVLKPGGLAILVVPCDRANFPFAMDDPDFHLYSWSVGNFGNLARAAGLEVIEGREILHRWPPKAAQLRRLLGLRALNLLCRIYGFLRRDRTQVRLVARAPV